VAPAPLNEDPGPGDPKVRRTAKGNRGGSTKSNSNRIEGAGDRWLLTFKGLRAPLLGPLDGSGSLHLDPVTWRSARPTLGCRRGPVGPRGP
jgi:hypothetical protein